MRLIDAIPLVQEAQRFRGVFKTDLEKYVADMFILMLDFAPTIEADSVKHGRWNTVEVTDDWEDMRLYSHIHEKCKYSYSDYDIAGYRFCPNCGCKMDLEGEL